MIAPTFSASVAAIRDSANVFLIRTPVVGGGPQDYTEYEMVNQGPGLGILHAWALRSIRACVDGVIHQLMDQSAFAPGNVGTVEFAINVGLMNQPLSSYSMYGFGHGHLAYAGLGIRVDDNPANYRGALPDGTVLRGQSVVFDANFVASLADGSPVANVSLAHVFDATGLRVAQTHNVIASGCGMQNSYSAMLPATGCNRISAGASAAVVVGLGNEVQTNFGPRSAFSMWHTARPNVMLDLQLPYGAPSDSGVGWGDCTTSKTFVLDNPMNQKLYVNCRSGDSPVAFTGQHNYLSLYRVRKV